MMWRREACIGLVTLLVILSATVTPIARAVPAQPLCNDTGTKPVLQDLNWQLLSPGYHDFMTKYDGAYLMEQGGVFIGYFRVDTNQTSAIDRGVSPDGVSWAISKTPVLTRGPSGSWDSLVVFSPDVVWNGTGYMMYYTGTGANGTSTSWRQIGVAFSSDGISWTKYAGNPVITHGPGAYDLRYTRGPSVIYENGTYKMWYWGTPTNALSSIDHATSKDGVHWTKYAGNPVFTGFSYSGALVAHSPSVMKVNGTYLMAFSDGFANIGYATSADGVKWSFNNATNVLESLSGWHNGYVDYPSLLLDHNKLLLWYYGTDNSNETSPYVAGIGFATCGLALIPSPTVTTTTAVTTATVTKNSISTSISTSTSTTTLVSTFIQNPNAPLFESATAGVVGFVAAMALAVAIIALRVRSRRPK